MNLNYVRGAGFGLAAAILLSALNPAAAVGASDKLDRGPKVGETIPHRLNATSQRGQAVDFSSVAGRKGLILLFTRSLDW